MPRVYTAKPYHLGELGSTGNASGMLIRQFRFPDTYGESDVLISADSDRCLQHDYRHASECFKRHTQFGELGLESWVREASDEEIIAFLKDILKADESKEWNGYRILGTVHRSNGSPIWHLELFARDPNGTTEVFTGKDAPNVKKEPAPVRSY